MLLDPSESINNMGTLRVDVLDAANLPSADRNGYSDPFCKFELQDETIFKTQVQKKTLNPAWNEFFETEIPSRTSAKLKCKVYDWDFAGEDDHLGDTYVDLSMLEPFRPQEVNLPLDGKSGTVRLRLLFRPSYITRTRQGSSTFSGTFAMPHKIVSGVAGVPIKGVGMAASGIGMGVGKGASFIRNGFKSKRNGMEKNESLGTISVDDWSGTGNTGTTESHISGGRNVSDSLTPSHTRNQSVAAASIYSTAGGAAPTGTATFTVVSADGYPPSSNLMVVIKQLPKEKTIHKTKHIKSPQGGARFDESFTAPCSADTQFQLQVRSHATFGADDMLGQTLFFVDESGAQQEKAIKAGSGQVIIKSNFVGKEGPGEAGAAGSPVRGSRRSFLNKRESGRVSREGTPN